MKLTLVNPALDEDASCIYMLMGVNLRAKNKTSCSFAFGAWKIKF